MLALATDSMARKTDRCNALESKPPRCVTSKRFGTKNYIPSRRWNSSSELQITDFRPVEFKLAHSKHAAHAFKLLLGEYYHVLDPLRVRDMRDFSMSIDDFEQVRNKRVKEKYLKIL
jgi:hypothetical protein